MRVWIQVESSPGDKPNSILVTCRSAHISYESAMIAWAETLGETPGTYDPETLTKPDGHTISLQEIEL